jgi:hypothetical protein
VNGDPIVIDDHLLLTVLLDEEPSELRPRGARVFTTGLWYHRLCRSVSDHAVLGGFSRALAAAGDAVAARAIEALTSLPDTIHLVSLRDLAWPMARLIDQGVRLNLMSLEALAAAEHLGAEICMSSRDENPLLLAAAGTRGIPARLIGG